VRQAASEARPYATRLSRHVLIVANQTLAGAELADLIRRGGEPIVVDMLAPVLASPIHYGVSDIDRELAEARVPDAVIGMGARATDRGPGRGRRSEPDHGNR
jgi:2-succinyl-5-enolpyruvyl-6-hydroxy-3-cyclohexene-1-carboxylate synthase